jgi:multiple sugar transport system permease protein
MLGRYKVWQKAVIYIVLVLMAFCTLFPLLYGIACSLRSDQEIFKYALPFSLHTLIPVDWTFQSYIDLFAKFHFEKPFLNTLIMVAVSIPLGCLINSIAAFSFATFQFKGKGILFGLVLVSFMIPFDVIAMPLYNIVDGFNWVDTWPGLIAPTLASGLVLFLFTQFFKDIPPSLIEAARVDGAGWPTIFVKIILPSSIPVFVTAGLMIFMDQWNAYLWPLLVARSQDIRPLQIALASFKMERSTLWSCMYAGTIFSAIIPLGLFLPFQKYFVQGITSSGIKG